MNCLLAGFGLGYLLSEAAITSNRVSNAYGGPVVFWGKIVGGRSCNVGEGRVWLVRGLSALWRF